MFREPLVPSLCAQVWRGGGRKERFDKDEIHDRPFDGKKIDAIFFLAAKGYIWCADCIWQRGVFPIVSRAVYSSFSFGARQWNIFAIESCESRERLHTKNQRLSWFAAASFSFPAPWEVRVVAILLFSWLCNENKQTNNQILSVSAKSVGKSH